MSKIMTWVMVRNSDPVIPVRARIGGKTYQAALPMARDLAPSSLDGVYRVELDVKQLDGLTIEQQTEEGLLVIDWPGGILKEVRTRVLKAFCPGAGAADNSCSPHGVGGGGRAATFDSARDAVKETIKKLGDGKPLSANEKQDLVNNLSAMRVSDLTQLGVEHGAIRLRDERKAELVARVTTTLTARAGNNAKVVQRDLERAVGRMKTSQPARVAEIKKEAPNSEALAKAAQPILDKATAAQPDLEKVAGSKATGIAKQIADEQRARLAGDAVTVAMKTAAMGLKLGDEFGGVLGTIGGMVAAPHGLGNLLVGNLVGGLVGHVVGAGVGGAVGAVAGIAAGLIHFASGGQSAGTITPSPKSAKGEDDYDAQLLAGVKAQDDLQEAIIAAYAKEGLLKDSDEVVAAKADAIADILGGLFGDDALDVVGAAPGDDKGFCPTGAGGGVDNSCGRGEAGGGPGSNSSEKPAGGGGDGPAKASDVKPDMSQVPSDHKEAMGMAGAIAAHLASTPVAGMLKDAMEAFNFGNRFKDYKEKYGDAMGTAIMGASIIGGAAGLLGGMAAAGTAGSAIGASGVAIGGPVGGAIAGLAAAYYAGRGMGPSIDFITSTGSTIATAPLIAAAKYFKTGGSLGKSYEAWGKLASGEEEFIEAHTERPSVFWAVTYKKEHPEFSEIWVKEVEETVSMSAASQIAARDWETLCADWDKFAEGKGLGEKAFCPGAGAADNSCSPNGGGGQSAEAAKPAAEASARKLSDSAIRRAAAAAGKAVVAGAAKAATAAKEKIKDPHTRATAMAGIMESVHDWTHSSILSDMVHGSNPMTLAGMASHVISYGVAKVMNWMRSRGGKMVAFLVKSADDLSADELAAVVQAARGMMEDIKAATSSSAALPSDADIERMVRSGMKQQGAAAAGQRIFDVLDQSHDDEHWYGVVGLKGGAEEAES